MRENVFRANMKKVVKIWKKVGSKFDSFYSKSRYIQIMWIAWAIRIWKLFQIWFKFESNLKPFFSVSFSWFDKFEGFRTLQVYNT